MTIIRGTGAPVSAIYRGTTPIVKINRGLNTIWTRAPIFDGFDAGDGFLPLWINDSSTGDLGALISDGLGFIVDGLGNVVGNIVGFVGDTINGFGKLVAKTGTSLIDAYCGAWGGTAPPNGLIGLINGIPIIGDFLADWLTGTFDITSIVGTIPIISKIAQLIGLIPDALGNLKDPLNYVVDALGNVVGKLTCGAFKPHLGSSEDVSFVIGEVGGAARMMIPDGLLSLNTQTSRFRYPTATTTDDGYLEVRIAEQGATDFVSQAYRRANVGSSSGVGIDFRNSSVSIVRRKFNTESLVLPNLGQFKSGDTLRLVQAGDVHTLYGNGDTVPIGVWNDAAGSALRGVANRSISMEMQGAKNVSQQREFSPSFDYIEAA